MGKITLKILHDEEIESCRSLCDELMRYQESVARIDPARFTNMNFDTRFKPVYDRAKDKFVLLAMDDELPIGYAFATINEVEAMRRVPVPLLPDWLEPHQKVGHFNNLYISDAYRGSGVGSQLFAATMDWLRSFDEAEYVFLHVSDGNEAAMSFYQKKGFILSHEIENGIITALYSRLRQ